MGRSEAEEQVERHHQQQQSAQITWKLEKDKLLLNISSSAKTVQEMKNQMKTLMENLSKVQKELQLCQGNMNTLNKKLTYDMTQCNTQILAMKEECNEKMAAAKREAQKMIPLLGDQKPPSPAAAGGAVVSLQKDTAPKPASDGPKGNPSAQDVGELHNTEAPVGVKTKAEDHLQTNERLEDKDSNRLKLLPTPKPSNQNRTLNLLANEDHIEEVMDIKGGELKGALQPTVGNVEEKEDEAIEYGDEGEIEKRLSQLKDEKAAAQDLEEELADYNGDDDNEPEFEADKQEELAKM
ncbi:Golgi membrane protein 1 isoform X2 [Brachyhypopomus gauderio]